MLPGRDLQQDYQRAMVKQMGSILNTYIFTVNDMPMQPVLFSGSHHRQTCSGACIRQQKIICSRIAPSGDAAGEGLSEGDGEADGLDPANMDSILNDMPMLHAFPFD